MPNQNNTAETPPVVVTILDTLRGWLENFNIQPEVANIASLLMIAVIIAGIAVLANWIAKKVILTGFNKFVEKVPLRWLKTLRDNHVFVRLSHLAPAAVINLLGQGLFIDYPLIAQFINSSVMIYVVVVWLLVFSALINTLQDFIEGRTKTAGVPIKGFAQAIKLIIFLVGGIFILSIIFGKSPVYFLSGIGALTAVLLLVFRDALLGLVAGVMISANQIVRIGDWIEMPSAGADGDVIDVSLTTVKVRNWDRTITTIPSYDLISKSFKNWRGMFENKGRRIKRSIYIDMDTIDFVDEARLEKLLKIRLLRPYLKGKLEEIQNANSTLAEDSNVLTNTRRLTNLGTFRAYCLAYLKAHPGIYQQELMIVRQLSPTEHGLPLEIYAFTNDTRWVQYEGIQSDIFDHFLSIINEFGLHVFQEPGGRDLRQWQSGSTEKLRLRDSGME